MLEAYPLLKQLVEKGNGPGGRAPLQTVLSAWSAPTHTPWGSAQALGLGLQCLGPGAHSRQGPSSHVGVSRGG